MAMEARWEIAPELGYLVHEHRELRHALERLPQVAHGAGGHVRHDLGTQLATIGEWLEHDVLPHLRWEERVFHPEVEWLAGLDPMLVQDRAEHDRGAVLVGRLTALRHAIAHEATPGQGIEARSIVEALHKLLLAHVDREDRLIRSLLAQGRSRPDGSIRTLEAGSLDPRVATAVDARSVHDDTGDPPYPSPPTGARGAPRPVATVGPGRPDPADSAG